MPKTIEQKLLNFINFYSLLPEGSRILLAVSGGADSVGLVEILVSLKSSGKINADFHIAHINHLLRAGDSFQDEEFVNILAQKHNLPITVEQIDVKKYAAEKKLSIETAARELRIDALCRIAKQNNCAAIATAHHKNDNAETVIHRLSRGTGFKGLCGIRPKTALNGTVFIRPMLRLCRSEIETYLSSQNIKWQTDRTNIDCRFTRNRIRYKLLPMLQKQSQDNLTEMLFELSQKTLKLYEKIEKQAQSAATDPAEFNDYHPLLQIEIVQKLLQQTGIGLQKFTNSHYNKILKFIKQGKTGKSLHLPSGAIIQKEQIGFYIGRAQSKPQKAAQLQLPIPGKVCFADWIIETAVVPADEITIQTVKSKKDNFIEWFDLENLNPPLFVRFRRDGDKFQPFGLGASKKVGKFITSAKIDFSLQNKLFIIQDNQKILWLVPARRSNEAKVMDKNRTLLKIKVSPKNSL
jgi:tRNA(Ile)-lysidine synthase